MPLNTAVPENTIIYEQPLNERIRTFLRLEFLFLRVDHALQKNTETHNRECIENLLDILSVFERSDLKQEIIKELERLLNNLSALENTPGVDRQALDSLLAELDQILDSLVVNKNSIGHSLRDNDFLYSIRQRSSIPGGTCDFDLPSYHFWLQHTDDETRQQQLLNWFAEFSQVRKAIDTALSLIRQSTGFHNVVAEAGFYQHSLDSNHPNQLIRIQLPRTSPFYPEISGGKHRFTVRMMQFDLNRRSQQVEGNIDFSLSCCSM